MRARVLLIDDEPRALSALVRQLDETFDVVTAPGGHEAIAAVERAMADGSPFAVVVCDMHMPGMDGIETLQRIRDRSPLIVGIMLTGDADQHTAIEAINHGSIFRFFIKPFDAARLAEGIAAALHQHDLLVAERRLAENEERWRLALEAVGDGVWDWNPQSEMAVYSRGWWGMLGLSPATERQSVAAWRDRVHPDDAQRLDSRLAALLDGKEEALRCEHRLRMSDGTYRWFLARGTVLFRGDGRGAIRVIGTHTDITERRNMEETLRRQAEELVLLATTDALTGLWNRRRFMEKADEELLRAVRYGRPVAAVMVDIDHFKRVNDSFGHAAGDAVLRQFCDILRGNLRGTDCLGRLGGEEFAVLLPESDGAGAVVVAEILRRAAAAATMLLPDGQTLRITASFGVAASKAGDETVADLLRRADEALYAAKERGRNQVVCHPDGAHRMSSILIGGNGASDEKGGRDG